MAGKPRPKPCFLDNQQSFGVRDGRKVWRSKDGRRLYTWDSMHGEIEVFNGHGWHLGSLDAVTGTLIKPAVKGRRLNV
jgi:hypothetical protein